MPAATRKIALTDRSLQALRPPPDGQRYTVWDAMMPGLAVRVSAKGKRTFYAVRRRLGQPQPTWVLLGVYPITSLAEARSEARQTLTALMAGQDPDALAAAKRRAAEAAAREAEAGTFGAVAEEFIKRYERKGLRTSADTAADIRRFLVPVWGERPIAGIGHRDVIEAVEAILDRGDEAAAGRRRRQGGPNAARHALAGARLVFGWAFSRDLIPVNPCARIKAAEVHGAPPARDRVLTDDELRAVWRAAAAYPYGPLLKMLALTGQRLSEVAEARWSEVDLDAAVLTIPAERMKGKIAHTVPLTSAAVAVLAELPRFTRGDFIFSTSAGEKPFSGFSKAKVRLDKGTGIANNWTLHDIRRTVRTALASIGVLPVIAELTIGHKQQGIAAVYDRHRYDAEKRDALTRWEARLLAIVAPQPDPAAIVVPLLARARA